MIICGYAGIGKSYVAHRFPGVIDLESTPFEKDWDRYAKCAVYYHNQGYLVFVSFHKEIRERICSMVPPEERISLLPHRLDVLLYTMRYRLRGNTKEFIDIQKENWDKWHDPGENQFETEIWKYLDREETLIDYLQRNELV